MTDVIVSSDGTTRTEAPDNVVAFSRPVDVGAAQAPHGDPFAVGKRRVAIVGFAPSSLNIAIQSVFVDPTWEPQNPDKPSEIWGLNELYKVPGVTKATRWFDIHDRRDGDISLRDPENIMWLKSQRMPVFMQDHFDDIPPSVRFPIELCTRHFRTNYFTNTISYELALAILEGRDERGWVVDPMQAFGEIHVYGVDMAQDAAAYSEYREQRPSVEYFLGWARALGIKTYVPPQSDLLKTTFMYGYEGTGVGVKAKMNARRGELQTQITNLNGQAQQLIAQAQQLQARAIGLSGAMEDTNYWDRCWTPGPEAFKVDIVDGKPVLKTFEGLLVKETSAT